MGLPKCDRCFRNDMISKAGFRLGKFAPKQVYFCRRCNHRFSMQGSIDGDAIGEIYYDDGKAYVRSEGAIFKWKRIRELDAKAVAAGA